MICPFTSNQYKMVYFERCAGVSMAPRKFKIIVLMFGILLFVVIYTVSMHQADIHHLTTISSDSIDPSSAASSDTAPKYRKAKNVLTKSNSVLQRRVHANKPKERTKNIPNAATPEVRHIAFLKVHKAASTTLQTIFFRFGYTRNLSFVIPEDTHYFSESTSSRHSLVPPKYGDHYDILCLHAHFNSTMYASVMPRDTVYVSVVRDPFRQFISAYHYFKTQYHWKYLTSIPGNAIENLIKWPEIYERGFLSYTRNSMARDFGFNRKHYISLIGMNSSALVGNSSSAVWNYLESLGTRFDFVLVAEYLDEGLILMKRMLQWKLKDILYISKNVNSPEKKISKKLMKTFMVRNQLDYLVYEFFYRKFEKKLEEGGDDLMRETLNFKTTLMKVQNFCSEEYFGEMVIDSTPWNERFTVHSTDCQLMATGEMSFVDTLRGNITSEA